MIIWWFLSEGRVVGAEEYEEDRKAGRPFGHYSLQGEFSRDMVRFGVSNASWEIGREVEVSKEDLIPFPL